VNLKNIRQLRGWTQIDLMHASGVHHTKISQIEKKRFRPSLAEQKKLSDALKTTLIEWR
jgi:transcriptional regulator with XRE-family HTH domain